LTVQPLDVSIADMLYRPFRILAGALSALASLTPAYAQAEDQEPPPPVLKNQRHPVFDYLLIESGYVIGGWANQRWQKVDREKLPEIPSGRDRIVVKGLTKKDAILRLYSKTREVGRSPVGKLIYGNTLGDSLVYAPAAEKADFALTADWDPFPRKPVAADKQRFKEPMNALLRAKRALPKRGASILSAEQIDLDNDGVDDFVVISGDRRAGGYWMAAVVYARPDGDHAEWITLLQADDKFTTPDGSVSFIDANGDGKLELVVKTFFGSGANTDLYDLQPDGKPKQQFGMYFGD
jgi:hypothetical protein